MTDQMIGAMIGSGLGLISILIGALWNAHLNRRRDDRLRQGEMKSLCAALLGDLCGTIISLNERVDFLAAKMPEDNYPVKERLAFADSVLMQPGNRKMELLSSPMARQVAFAYRALELSRNILGVIIEEHSRGTLTQDMLAARVYSLKQLVATLGETAETLAEVSDQVDFWNEMLEDIFSKRAVKPSQMFKKP